MKRFIGAEKLPVFFLIVSSFSNVEGSAGYSVSKLPPFIDELHKAVIQRDVLDAQNTLMEKWNCVPVLDQLGLTMPGPGPVTMFWEWPVVRDYMLISRFGATEICEQGSKPGSTFYEDLQRCIFVPWSSLADGERYIGHHYSAYLNKLKGPFVFNGESWTHSELRDLVWREYYQKVREGLVSRVKARHGFNFEASNVAAILNHENCDQIAYKFSPGEDVMQSLPFCAAIIATAHMMSFHFTKDPEHFLSQERIQRVLNAPSFYRQTLRELLKQHNPEMAEKMLKDSI